jgi:hypothetical protein
MGNIGGMFSSGQSEVRAQPAGSTVPPAESTAVNSNSIGSTVRPAGPKPTGSGVENTVSEQEKLQAIIDNNSSTEPDKAAARSRLASLKLALPKVGGSRKKKMKRVKRNKTNKYKKKKH